MRLATTLLDIMMFLGPTSRWCQGTLPSSGGRPTDGLEKCSRQSFPIRAPDRPDSSKLKKDYSTGFPLTLISIWIYVGRDNQNNLQWLLALSGAEQVMKTPKHLAKSIP